MTTLKESITTIQKSLEAALREMKNVEQVADKMEQALGGFPSVPVKRPTAKAKVSQARKGSSTDTVLHVITSSKEGISTEGIIEKTGFDKRKVYSILARAKKDDKIKCPKRGFYQAA